MRAVREAELGAQMDRIERMRVDGLAHEVSVAEQRAVQAKMHMEKMEAEQRVMEAKHAIKKGEQEVEAVRAATMELKVAQQQAAMGLSLEKMDKQQRKKQGSGGVLNSMFGLVGMGGGRGKEDPNRDHDDGVEGVGDYARVPPAADPNQPSCSFCCPSASLICSASRSCARCRLSSAARFACCSKK